MSEAAGENGNDNDSIPSLEGSSLGEIGNWMRVKLDFNVPDTGPYEQTQRDLLESATKGVNQNVMWTVTRTYGYNKKDPNWGEKKLIKIKFNAQFGKCKTFLFPCNSRVSTLEQKHSYFIQ